MNCCKDRWETAYIGAGSNLGNREALLAEAIRMLDEHQLIRVEACSAVYETEPVGYLEQPAFLNMVLRIATALPPEGLLAYMHQVELLLERKREVRWGPRTMDLDILLYGSLALNTPDLIVPHPRMHERAFVLIPLQDVLLSDLLSEAASIEERLATLEGKEGVKLWKDKL
jgi:2-amino-4-hydroxy-6-hydroxymethyldihydropteridine diphosphokinase